MAVTCEYQTRCWAIHGSPQKETLVEGETANAVLCGGGSSEDASGLVKVVGAVEG